MTFDVSSEELNCVARQAGELLIKKGLKLSPAESCTGGLIAKTLTDVPGSSEFFECGIVSYSDKIKAKVLGVSETMLAEKTAVSEDVAIQMADGVRRVSGADIGISVTGVAGPGPDGGHPEGEIYLALSFEQNHIVKRLMTNTVNMRDYNRKKAAFTALDMVCEFLKSLPDKEG